jgi:hypothetical protein
VPGLRSDRLAALQGVVLAISILIPLSGNSCRNVQFPLCHSDFPSGPFTNSREDIGVTLARRDNLSILIIQVNCPRLTTGAELRTLYPQVGTIRSGSVEHFKPFYCETFSPFLLP